VRARNVSGGQRRRVKLGGRDGEAHNSP
jgi:hypothetical protein